MIVIMAQDPSSCISILDWISSLPIYALQRIVQSSLCTNEGAFLTFNIFMIMNVMNKCKVSCALFIIVVLLFLVVMSYGVSKIF